MNTDLPKRSAEILPQGMTLEITKRVLLAKQAEGIGLRGDELLIRREPRFKWLRNFYGF